MLIDTPSRMVRYGFSIAAVFLSLGIGFVLQPFFPQGSLLLFVPAVALSAWFGGLGPGLFAGLVSIITTTFFFINPTGSLLFESVTDAIRIGIFAIVALVVSSLSEARRRAIEQMRLTLSSIGEAVITTDRLGHVLTINKVAELLTGQVLEQVKGLPVDNVFRVIDEQTRLTVANQFQRILDGESISDSVKSVLLLARTGQEIPIEFSGAPVRDAGGQLAGMVLVFRDVGERRRAEREIRRTTNILTAVLNGAADPIFVKDMEGRFQYVNQSLAQNIGIEVGQVIGKRNIDFVAPEAARAADAIDRRIIRTAQPEITDDKFRIGAEVRNFQTVRTPYRDAEGKVAGIIGISRDLTERQRAEEALRASEERYRQIVETAREGIWLLDGEGITIFANQATANMLGYDVQEMPGRSLFDFVFEEDKPGVERRLELRRLGENQQVDARLRRKDGAELWVLASSSPIRDANGEVTGALTMLTDLTARKRIEAEREQLLSSEQAARMQAEANTSRLELLAHASRVLASSLDYERTLAEFTRLVVPQQADWCAVSLLNADGRMQTLGLSHADPAKLQAVTELLRSYPLDVESLQSVQDAMQTCRAYIVPEVPESLISGLPADSKYGQLLKILPVRSYMVVPLIARARVLGVIFLVRAESKRRYRPEDAPFMEELAHRAAMAIDSASLYHEVQQTNAQLEMRVAERTAQLETASQELRRLSGHLEGTRERERARIARELHDQLAQHLTAAKITASQLSKKVERGADGATVLKDIDVVLGTLDESIDSIRTIVSELRPDLLEHFGLEAAIEEQVREFQVRTGIEAHFASDIVGLDWGQEHSLALYRVLQESLTNIARHAQATRVDISLKADLEQAKLLLEVRDNGRGISLAEINKRNRFGLIGMRERVALLGGTIDIRGAPGAGTVIEVSVPMEVVSAEA